MQSELIAGGRQISLSAPLCMGILNVTPDSFSDGSQLGEGEGSRFRVNLDQVLRRAEDMVGEGVAFLDVGGESTRPGAVAVDEEEELQRVIPVIEALRARFDTCISVDTSSPVVMRAAIACGAGLINDIRALQVPGAIEQVASSNVGVCLMHMQGQPRSMQESVSYGNVVTEVTEFLAGRVAACVDAGVSRQRLLVDPGFGFGKEADHNYTLLRQLQDLSRLDLPVLVGLSRKSMLGAVTGRPVEQRLAASVAAATLALQGGAKIIRTHDVAETMDAIRIHCAYAKAG